MKFTKTASPGQCRRMRCKNVALHEIGEYEICEAHRVDTIAYVDEVLGKPTGQLDLSGFGGPDPELLEAFSDFQIETSEDYLTAVSVLHDAIDGRERDDYTRKEAGRPHYEPWKAVNESFKSALAGWDSLIEAVKARIIAARVAGEQAQDQAIAEGRTPPPLLEDPPGVSIKPEVQVSVANLNLVPEQFLKVVLDTDAVAEHVLKNPREEIQGLNVSRTYKVCFRRPSEDK